MNLEVNMYRIIWLLALLLLVGCGGTPEQAVPPDVPGYSAEGSAVADLAIAVITTNVPPTPSPTPKPAPGSVCPDCKGTGKVGDGRVFSTCLACNGTGKVPGAAPGK